MHIYDIMLYIYNSSSSIFDKIGAICKERDIVVSSCMYPYPLAVPLIATLSRVEGQVYMTQL